MNKFYDIDLQFDPIYKNILFQIKNHIFLCKYKTKDLTYINTSNRFTENLFKMFYQIIKSKNNYNKKYRPSDIIASIPFNK